MNQINHTLRMNRRAARACAGLLAPALAFALVPVVPVLPTLVPTNGGR